ncbi:hypothetical protein DFS34DRAFT_594895 [Phlyctochytrium arcticum]|nr:hypothetical protein DFS34DRAFT_594895 [Phlyctochytrium arcticum]
MRISSCDTDNCVWAKYVRWYDKAWNAYFATFDAGSASWPESFKALYIAMAVIPYQNGRLCEEKKNNLGSKFLALYKESKEHLSEYHQKPQTISLTTPTSDDESTYEVVEPSTPASNQDVQSISDEISDAGDSVKSFASASGAGKTVVAQSDMEARMEKALMECKEEMAVAQQKAAADTERFHLECKTQKEVAQKTAASEIEKAVLECKNEMELVRENAAADYKKGLLEFKNQKELVQKNVAEDIEKRVMECKKQMAADYEQALGEFKNQVEAMQKNMEDRDKGMARKTVPDLAITQNTSDPRNPVLNTAHAPSQILNKL